MIIKIDGLNIKSVMDFHCQLSEALNFGPYYGKNLDALWDSLTSIKRPVKIIWNHSEIARSNLGVAFDKIVNLLKEAEQLDKKLGLTERIEVELQ